MDNERLHVMNRPSFLASKILAMLSYNEFYEQPFAFR